MKIFFKPPKSVESLRIYYMYTNAIILATILFFSLLGERYVWHIWGVEFQHTVSIIGSILLLIVGVLCTYFTANAIARIRSRDITERKRAEEAVTKSEERFRLLTDNSIDCIWTMDKRLRFTYLSPASLERIMGVTVSDWLGTKLSLHFSKKEFLKVGALVAKSLRNYKATSHTVFETKMFDGRRKEIDVEISSKALFDGKGKLIGLQGVTKDITDRKQAERELAKYRNHLEKLVEQRTAELANRVSEVEKLNVEMVNLSGGLKTSNKSLEVTTGQLTLANRELESFAYSVSHDLGAPLRSIDGFSQILLEDYSDILDEQGKHYLDRVRTCTHNMGQLIDDLLNLSHSRRHIIDKKTINMESIVKEVCNSLKNELKDRKVDFVINDCPPILADPHLVKIVFTNLLSNTIKFTRVRENAKIETGAVIKDGQTIFFIKDNGVGFDMRYAGKLFAAFQRLHSAEDYEGSGIGLAIVQRIIHRHGGKIWAESGIGVGTTFYFTLMEKK